ncbi:MAG: hypothetical protein IPN49_03675 [Saprospiraceae bacterium]|nr:hypothetical protein [Saprospiraceae bacterium]
MRRRNHEAITQATTYISPYRDEPSGSQTVMSHEMKITSQAKTISTNKTQRFLQDKTR